MSIHKAVLAVGALGALLGLAQPVSAQATATPRRGWELRGTSGGFIPTGGMRQTLKSAQLSGAQLSFVMHPAVTVTSSFSWAASRDVSVGNTPKLDVFTSDVGVELCPKEWQGERIRLTSFASLGAGARSYNYRKLAVDATHNLAGYAGAGGEIGYGRVGLRLEVRDYMTGFKPLAGVGTADVRNDVVVMAGLRFNRRRS